MLGSTSLSVTLLWLVACIPPKNALHSEVGLGNLLDVLNEVRVRTGSLQLTHILYVEAYGACRGVLHQSKNWHKVIQKY